MIESPIRVATRRDVPSIVALESACFARREERYRAVVVLGLVARRSAIVLVQPGRAGCAAWAGATVRDTTRGPVGRISAVAVHPDARGRGLGARLLEVLVARLEAAGALRIVLEVREDNAAARSLYLRHGFVVTERLEDWYAPGLDAVRMERR